MRVRDYIRVWHPETPRESVMRVIAEVADEHFVTPDSLLGRERFPEVVRARFHAWHRIRAEFGHSLPHIGQVFGRDHSTILHGIRRWRELNG